MYGVSDRNMVRFLKHDGCILEITGVELERSEIIFTVERRDATHLVY